jgi:acetyl-CoA acetyltransferase
VRNPVKDQVAIVGLGSTPHLRESGSTARTLALRACRDAIRDAGLEAVDIDGIAGSTEVQAWEIACGLWSAAVCAGGSTTRFQIVEAMNAVYSGARRHGRVLPHDGFSVITTRWFEVLGYCGDGEAEQFLAARWDAGQNRILIGGRVPVNTHGGSLSGGGTQGSGHVREAVLQLRGQAGERQAPGARTALLTPGGFFFNAGGIVLRSADCPSAPMIAPQAPLSDPRTAPPASPAARRCPP